MKCHFMQSWNHKRNTYLYYPITYSLGMFRVQKFRPKNKKIFYLMTFKFKILKKNLSSLFISWSWIFYSIILATGGGTSLLLQCLKLWWNFLWNVRFAEKQLDCIIMHSVCFRYHIIKLTVDLYHYIIFKEV